MVLLMVQKYSHQKEREIYVVFYVLHTCVDGHAARLGTAVTVLVAWTKFRYAIGSPSFGTKSVGTIGTILTRERRK
jgi:hypothetical protein